MGALTEVRISNTELERHNSLKSRPYVAIRGSVYDITDFVDRHPGGRDIMLLSAGRDVTQVYETYHDIAKTEKVLRKYRIGVLTDAVLPTFPPPSKFQTTLRKRVADYFKNTGQDPKFHAFHLIHYAAVATTIVTSYYAQFWIPAVRDSLILSTLAALILGVACAQSCFSIVHDASHASFTHNPWLWTFFGAWHDFMNGASHVAWFYQHVLGHHPYTNLKDADPDVATSDKHFRRIRPHQKWFPFYLQQHIYAPLMYSFYGLKSRWDDVSNIYITKSRGAIKINPLQPHQHALFWGGKAFFFLHRIVIPAFYVSLPRVLFLFMVADIATSLVLALVFQANHVVEHVSWPQPDAETKVVPVDWMEMQIVTAQDYSHDRFWPTKLTGGLNYQVVHHAFPQICQWWYIELGPLVKDTCREFGVTYHLRDSFYEAIKDHIDLLWMLGRKEGSAEVTGGVAKAVSGHGSQMKGDLKEEVTKRKNTAADTKRAIKKEKHSPVKHERTVTITHQPSDAPTDVGPAELVTVPAAVAAATSAAKAMPFSYPAALAYLYERDPNLRALVEGTGKPCRVYGEPREVCEGSEPAAKVQNCGVDAFKALATAIIYQQLSGKAAAAIRRKWLLAFPDSRAETEENWFPTPQQVRAQDAPTGRAAGLSFRKHEYLHALADKFIDESITSDRLAKMDDDAISELLTSVKGIGQWTGEASEKCSLNKVNAIFDTNVAVAALFF
ncbi:hypothetical protein HDU88_003363 [Geranomyces variabilis]|nr:hypothetical protein HDU88_003363 [Geranomyces variabilis]